MNNPAASNVANDIVNVKTVMPKSLPMMIAAQTLKTTNSILIKPPSNLKSEKVLIFSEQYLARNNASDSFANSDAWIETGPSRIQR